MVQSVSWRRRILLIKLSDPFVGIILWLFRNKFAYLSLYLLRISGGKAHLLSLDMTYPPQDIFIYVCTEIRNLKRCFALVLFAYYELVSAAVKLRWMSEW